MLRWNPHGDYPQVDESVYIDSSATVIGNVIIGKNVFIAPGAAIRADEQGNSIIINDNCNIQDNAVIHSLSNTTVEIDDNTSLAHSCVVHGPCRIGKRCFIGFGSIIFNSTLGDDVAVKYRAVVEGVKIPTGRLIANGEVIDSAGKVEGLRIITEDDKLFSRGVVKVNLALIEEYKKRAKVYG